MLQDLFIESTKHIANMKLVFRSNDIRQTQLIEHLRLASYATVKLFGGGGGSQNNLTDLLSDYQQN